MTATPVEYQLLAAFVAVAEQASFSKAAKQLGITKSTVSRAVTRLETLVGAELVHRNTHRVSLSTAGTALYERTAPHLTALERALGTLPERAEEPSGQLRITVPHDFAVIVLPELLAQFAVRYPKVSFDVRVSNQQLDVVGERFDVAVRASVGSLKDSTLKTRALGLGAMGFYAAPAYLARRGEPKSFGDPKHDWVSLPSSVSLLESPKDFRPRLIVDDMLTLRNLLREEAGVGLLPHFVTEEYVREGRLKPTLTSHKITAASFHLLYPSSGQVPRKVSAFRDFVVERLSPRRGKLNSL